jgi:hypothetical protein
VKVSKEAGPNRPLTKTTKADQLRIDRRTAACGIIRRKRPPEAALPGKAKSMRYLEKKITA